MTDPLPADPGTDGSDTAGSLLFIGTATTLIRYGELAVLTDPNFLHQGQRAYLGYGLTAKRLTEPALIPEQLPALDLIVLSHLHGDHWDRQAQRGLDRQLPIVTTPHASKRLQIRGFSRATGLRTWGSTEMVKGDTRLRITSMPGRHAPGLLRRVLPPVMGSLLEFGSLNRPVELRMYLTGDTLFVDDLREIPVRYPAIDAAVLHLGGTRLPGGLMVTMDATQGADLLELVKPGLAIPVHYDDYGLFKSPLSDFRAEVSRRGLTDSVRFVDRGDTVALTGPARD
ncbi:MAG TPA: MBL fold metallo-hydrolase [Jatrophihabitans sp.]|jgi:L-ascorbate metabolism protein UlaG (beta-lactamase superfamily)|nr:MBL fold metallo-hydrolase [Jatrophihabitans sp.]